MGDTPYIRWFETLGVRDVPVVGGKNASLGEMVCGLKGAGIQVPDGYATTAQAYWDFLEANNLKLSIGVLHEQLKFGRITLADAGQSLRTLVLQAKIPPALANAIRLAYQELGGRCRQDDVAVAVRSSAAAEDLPDASFAGQHETFLNVHGEAALLSACQRCFASLFTNRAISYRQEKGFDPMKIALSIGIQKMVRSDKAGAGVMFSLDTDTGFPNVILISAAWGLGENIVQGAVTPDEYVVFKPLLDQADRIPILEKKLGSKQKRMVYSHRAGKTTHNIRTSSEERRTFVLRDEEILQLARWGSLIETHYGKPMDMEWAKDGETGQLYMVQARPETVQSRRVGTMKSYVLKEQGKTLVEGVAIGEAIVVGQVQVIRSARDIQRFKQGSVLVTSTTDPDWVPIMKKAAGIITNQGGRTSHAAIVSRELGIPAVVGTGRATDLLKDGQSVTVSCAAGETGVVYGGELAFEIHEVNMDSLPKTRTQILLNIASPEAALHWWRLPVQGIGLARMEFIINDLIKIHPMALIDFDRLQDASAKKRIAHLTAAYADKTEYFVDRLARGIARIAASRYPDPVIVRMSDFKTNEYANLIGGRAFEPLEENPMIGFRGASRYYNDRYRRGFALECRAIKRVREQIGLENVLIMIPFCRTLEEADAVLKECAANALERGKNGLQVYVMCEIPSNVILAEQFADRFDGFSIGSNDLTQLVLGVDRDSRELAPLFDERNDAVKTMIREVIKRAHRKGCKVGICGQAPSDYPDFAEFLVRAGIDSISLNPDSVVGVLERVARVESELKAKNPGVVQMNT